MANRPDLIDKSSLHNDHEHEGQCIAGNGGRDVQHGDGREVFAPYGIEFAEPANVVSETWYCTSNGKDQASDVKDRGATVELRSWSDKKHNQEHDKAGSDLRAIIDANIEGLNVELINERNWDADRCDPITLEERDVLGEWVEDLSVRHGE